MKFYEQSLDGVFLVEPEPFGDERGIFRRHFCENEFSKNGFNYCPNCSICYVIFYSFSNEGFKKITRIPT